MKDKEFKKNLAYEVIIFLGLMALLMFITRIWAILFLIILGIFIAALRLLFKRTEKVEIIEPAARPAPLPKPETEKDILRRAYGLIQQRITEEIDSLHPSARWQWLTPNAMASIEKDEPVAIILNGAGGYRKALVNIHNLVFKGLVFETAQADNPDIIQQNEVPLPDTDKEETFDSGHDPEEDNKDSDPEEPETVNYEYLAFEWVDAHLLLLNDRVNEAIGQGQNTLLIPESELPVKDSWQDICRQLINSDFADAVANGNGILVSSQQ